MLQHIRKNKSASLDYWRKRFASDPEGWVAGGDRRWTDEVNHNSALQVMSALTDMLERHAAPFGGKSLLDAGCGMGHFTEMARKLGFDATGTDFCDEAVQGARQRYPESDFRVADLVSLNLSRRFQVIITLNVLVAVSDPAQWRQALRCLADHLAPNGVIVILETLRQSDQATAASAHVAFRSLAEYRDALADVGLAVRHHEQVELSAEDLRKDFLVIEHDLDRT
jgi:2-polyprenyl-3-methyl-5-hydroxy-6-metoxy-1,4-benzoquinol methylase